MIDVRFLKVVGRHTIGSVVLRDPQFQHSFGVVLLSLQVAILEHAPGFLITSENAPAMYWCRLVNCFVQRVGTLSGPGNFQFAALVTLDLTSSTVSSYHSIWISSSDFLLLFFDPFGILIMFHLLFLDVLPKTAWFL